MMYLRCERYEEIKQEVFDIYYDYDLSGFPVDVFALAERMQIVVKSYEGYSGEEIDKFLSTSADGMSYYFAGDKSYHILYNQDIGKERVRFTIAHEIGHIVLNHTDSTEEAETEADFFAQWLLVPEAVLIYHHIKDLVEIKNRFDVSYKCAKVCLDKLNVRLGKIGGSITELEKSFLKQINVLGGDGL